MNAAKVYLPLPDKHGTYRYPDGSIIAFSKQVRKWRGWWAPENGNSPGCPLRGDNDETSYFDTALETAQALFEGGEGPARDTPATKGQPQ